MGTTIGDNCIIGAGAVVKGDFPSNVVIAGNPAKVVCGLNEQYEKNKQKWIENAKKCAIAIHRNAKRLPTIEEMSDGYYWLYMPHTDESIDLHPEYFRLSADEFESVRTEFKKTEPIYKCFEDFLRDCGFDDEINAD